MRAPSLRSKKFSHTRRSGGPAGLVYGFLVACVGTLSVFTTLGELASMYALHRFFAFSLRLIKTFCKGAYFRRSIPLGRNARSSLLPEFS